MEKQSNSRKLKKKKKSNYSKFWVSFIIVSNIVFVAVVFIAFLKTGMEPSTLITAWFSFTTVELWQLARIKVNKIKKEENLIKNNNDFNECG